MTRGESFVIRGWAITDQPRAIFDEVFLTVDDERLVSLPSGLPRADVAAALGDATLVSCGFAGVLNVDELPLGMHKVGIVGRLSGIFERLQDLRDFAVLASPMPTTDMLSELPAVGRIRGLRDTFSVARDDSRGSGAIRRGASLVIEGWTLSSDSPKPPDAIAILIANQEIAYRVEAQMRMEPEAGVVYGVGAVESGFYSYVDCADIEPGFYALSILGRVGEAWYANRTGRNVEIMNEGEAWLPSALPIFAAPICVDLDVPICASLVAGDEFIVAAAVVTSEPLAAAFIRFDGIRSIPLTLTSQRARDGKATHRIAAILRPQLALGAHTLEIMLLDTHSSGMWRAFVSTLMVKAPNLSESQLE